MEYKTGEYINLTKAQKAICSREEQNGYSDQYFSKEEVKFRVLYIDEDRRKVICIADKPTKQELCLRGEIGYKNGVEELHRICKEISRKRRSKEFDTRRYRKEQILGR